MTDKIETLNKRLKEVKEKFEALKKCGIDEEILEIYLAHKTKLSKKNIRLLLNHLDKFYTKLIKEEMVKALEETK